MENQTTFENKLAILSQLWLDYRDDEEFTDFIEYNDIGLPLSYILAEGVAVKNDRSIQYIDETFDLLLASLEIEDEGFETLTDLFEIG
jgi:hypothetical protein